MLVQFQDLPALVTVERFVPRVIKQKKCSFSSRCDCSKLKNIYFQVSLDVTTGSSLATGTIPDTELGDLSFTSTNQDQSPGGQSTLPPALPELRSSAQLKKLKILGASFLGNENAEEETLSLHPRPRPTSLCPDGTLSSSGVWTASEGDREEEGRHHLGKQQDDDHLGRQQFDDQEVLMPRAIVARPHSSLSAGVVSDCSTATWREETTLREGDVTLEEGGSIHSCDTEGYYTTFHDFDGLQEVLADVHLVIHEDGEEGEEMDEKDFEVETTQQGSRVSLDYSNSEVVLRKRKGGKVPPPPQRLSSLGRESTGTVVAREDLAKEETKEDVKDLTNEEIKDLVEEETKEEEKENQRQMELREQREGSVVSNDVSFDSEERQERISAKTLMAAEHIPSLCNITPSHSGQNTPVNSSPVSSR